MRVKDRMHGKINRCKKGKERRRNGIERKRIEETGAKGSGEMGGGGGYIRVSPLLLHGGVASVLTASGGERFRVGLTTHTSRRLWEA